MSHLQANTVPEIPPAAAFGVDAGVEQCWMDFGGARMRYLRTGSGPALILLHGLLGYSFSWRFAMPALAPYATVYALDTLGAGFSDRPRIDHSMRATALRLLEFAEHVGLTSFDLLGTSRGGAVAMCAAALCEAAPPATASGRKLRVRRLILVAPVNPYSPHGRTLAAFAGTRFGAAIVRAVLDHLPSLHPYWHARMYGDRSRIRPGTLEGYTAPLAIPGLFDHALSIVSTWGADLRELEMLLPALSSIPTLLIWGEKDPAVYASSMEPLAKCFRKAERVVFPGVGHLPYEECPQEFNAALLKFLTG
jgi:pimeloyl-ACP methyl ester carboxylesterase